MKNKKTWGIILFVISIIITIYYMVRMTSFNRYDFMIEMNTATRNIIVVVSLIGVILWYICVKTKSSLFNLIVLFIPLWFVRDNINSLYFVLPYIVYCICITASAKLLKN